LCCFEHCKAGHEIFGAVLGFEDPFFLLKVQF